MKLRVLYIAYPLLPVSGESAGGAEQVLHAIEQEMSDRGHRTCVAAAAGTRISGELYVTGQPISAPDAYEQREREHHSRILELLRNQSGDFDLIHDSNGGFWKVAHEVDLPVLSTLHLPPDLCPGELWGAAHWPNLFFNCVSSCQIASFNGLPNLISTVSNGIDLQRFSFSRVKGDYLLWLGRICEEKGAHVAIEVARLSRRKLVLAGAIYPFTCHQQYFERKVLPHLDGDHIRWVQAPNLQQRVELLQNACAVLIPSLADETSSMVAMEAMASGTPVLAFRRGALSEIIVHGHTGFLSSSAEEMAAQIDLLAEIDPQFCRRHIEASYSATRMVDDYENLYRQVMHEYAHRGLRVTGVSAA
jgi:glycosyltransferase involved in cell wall biosynthesis